MVSAPFSVLEPSSESPVLVEVPHAGTYVDPASRAGFVAPPHALVRDADLWVDELYQGATEAGATLLVGHYSRYVVDLNRAEGDVDGGSVRGVQGPLRATRGVIWRLTGEGLPVLSEPLPPEELERRLASVYRPYHDALSSLVRRKIERFGLAVVLAAHSMPSVGVSASGRRSTRADVVPGTRGRTSADPRFIDLVDAYARRAGCSVAHDDPYRGGFTTVHYGRPRERAHVVQVELARRLYMDETTLERSTGFEATRDFCRGLVAELVREARA